MSIAVDDEHISTRMRLRARGWDGVTLLILPAVALMLGLFIYPFLYGFWLSFQPKAGSLFANYARFFADPYLYETVAKTLWIAVPVTLLNLLAAIPVAFRVRLMQRQRWLTTLLVLPITLGTVLVAEGLLNYLGPQGWLNRTLIDRKSTRLNSSHLRLSRMPSSA